MDYLHLGAESKKKIDERMLPLADEGLQRLELNLFALELIQDTELMTCGARANSKRNANGMLNTH